MLPATAEGEVETREDCTEHGQGTEKEGEFDGRSGSKGFHSEPPFCGCGAVRQVCGQGDLTVKACASEEFDLEQQQMWRDKAAAEFQSVGETLQLH